MKSEKYLLDVEGNIYIFDDGNMLETHILKDYVLEEAIPYDDTNIILYDDEFIYELPADEARHHIAGKRKMAEILDNISALSPEDITDDELSKIAPVIYKIYEEELMVLCEKEGENVRLYQVSAVTGSVSKPAGKQQAVAKAEAGKASVSQVKENVKQKTAETKAEPAQKDSFLAKTEEEHKDESFFSNIKNLSKKMAWNTFCQVKSGNSGVSGAGGGGGGGGGWGDEIKNWNSADAGVSGAGGGGGGGGGWDDEIKRCDINNSGEDRKLKTINDTNLTGTDKTIINNLKLNDMKPGQKKKISGDLMAKIGAGSSGTLTVKGGIGAGTEVTIERDEKDPNKFILTTGAEVFTKGGGDLGEIGPASIKAEGKNEISGKLAFTLDLAKKGEATDAAAYLLRSAGSLTEAGKQIDLIDAIPGIDIPGEKIDFIKNHFKSLETEGAIGGELSGKIGKLLGLEGTIAGKLSAGNKLEKTDEGGWKITGSFGGEGSLSIDMVGGDKLPGTEIGLEGKSTIAQLKAKQSMDSVVTFNKDGSVTNDAIFKYNLIGEEREPKLIKDPSSLTENTVNKGAELELTANLSNVMKSLPPDMASEMDRAIKNGDYDQAKKIFQEKAGELLLNPSLELAGKYTTYDSTNLELKGEAGIVQELGGSLSGKISMENEIPTSSYNGSAGLSQEGVKIKYNESIGNDMKEINISWKELVNNFQKGNDEKEISGAGGGW